MTRKQLFLSVVVLILLAVSYEIARFIFTIGHKNLGVTRGSVSETQSKASGFYIGKYTPAKRLIELRNISTIEVPDAWVEHAWKSEMDLFFRETKKEAKGYFFYIPIPADETASGRRPIWTFPFTLELQERNGNTMAYRGTGFDSNLGFLIFLDSIPDTLTFTVKEKQNGDTVTDLIEFKRAF
jgi:hypothetical protein